MVATALRDAGTDRQRSEANHELHVTFCWIYDCMVCYIKADRKSTFPTTESISKAGAFMHLAKTKSEVAFNVLIFE